MMTDEINLTKLHTDHAADVYRGLTSIDPTQLAYALDILVEAATSQYPVFVGGNGASAAISQHWACDHLKGSSCGRFNNHVISLATNVPLMTAISNDISYEEVFTVQLDRHTRLNDPGVVVLISSSGTSPNVVHTAQFVRAHRPNLQLITLTGFTGGPLRDLADVNLHVPLSAYETVEDVHSCLMHIMAKALRQRLSQLPQ